MKTMVKTLKVLSVISLLLFASSCTTDKEPTKPEKVRLSRLVVDSTQLNSYKALLKEEIEASIEKEAGVLTLYAVFETKQPTHLTILEMYASEEAYKEHVKTPHFLKYKNGTLNMVKELELIDTDPLIPDLKIK
jgi:quinol monooxygenase YgiN